ncbi:MAG: hypothetical protein KDD38_01310 [Bdellovibrionales bacterium]|nr:hypothetical protein [Bdellovibrionales bacterium]
MVNKVLLSLILSLSFIAVGCNGGGGGSKQKKQARAFEALLEDQTGHPYKITKAKTKIDGYSVFQDQVTGEYIAYNVSKFDKKTMTTIDQYLAVAVDGVDIVRNLNEQSTWVETGYWNDVYDTVTYYEDVWDEYCECWTTESYTETYYVDSYWVDTSHYVYTYHSGGFVFDNKDAQSKDLETLEALKEDVAEKFVTYKLTSEYSLSNTRAAELAKLVTRYQKLDNVRELTDAESNIFAMDALGVSMSQIENALKDKSQGTEKSYEDMLSIAAQVNKTSVEQIGKFFDDYVLGEE